MELRGGRKASKRRLRKPLRCKYCLQSSREGRLSRLRRRNSRGLDIRNVRCCTKVKKSKDWEKDTRTIHEEVPTISESSALRTECMLKQEPKLKWAFFLHSRTLQRSDRRRKTDKTVWGNNRGKVFWTRSPAFFKD